MRFDAGLLLPRWEQLLRGRCVRELLAGRCSASLLTTSALLAVAGCGGDDAAPRSGDASQLSGAPADPCSVTPPDGRAVNGNHGDPAELEVILPGSGLILGMRRGAKPPPGDHLTTEDVSPGGEIAIKFPWWSGHPKAADRLRISGRSLDGVAGRVRGDYPRPVSQGLYPGRLVFPAEGCWRVTGRTGPAKLTFVVAVVDCVREPKAHRCTS
jgi:hypothetical protein